jgi:hypothetical protein
MDLAEGSDPEMRATAVKSLRRLAVYLDQQIECGSDRLEITPGFDVER